MPQRQSLTERGAIGAPIGLSLAPGMWSFRSAWPRRLLEPVNIVCLGGSMTLGTGATAVEYTWVQRLAYLLRGVDRSAALLTSAGGGVHYRADHTGWTVTGGTPTEYGQDLGTTCRLLPQGTTMQRTAPATDGFEIHFMQGSNVGSTLRYQIDNTATVDTTPDTVGTDRADGVIKTATVTRGSHAIKITAQSGSALISGVYANDGDRTTGVRVFNAGKTGLTSAMLTATGNSAWVNQGAMTNATRLAVLQPVLVILAVGPHEWPGVTAQTFESNIRQALRIIRLAVHRPTSVLLVHLPRRLDITNPAVAWSEYGRVLRTIAFDTPDTDFLDAGTGFPASVEGDVDLLFEADAIHPSNRGHGVLAVMVHDHLMRRVQYRSVAPSAAPELTGQAAVAPSTLSGLVSAWRASSLATADNGAVASWAAYAGSAPQTLVQATATRQPTMRIAASGLRRERVVAFDGAAGTNGDAMTCTLTSRVNPPVTVAWLCRINRSFGTLWTGYQAGGAGPYLGMKPGSTDFQFRMAAGATTAPNALEVITGIGRYAAYVARYDGTANSALFQTRYPKQAIALDTTSANAGLPGLVLAAGQGATDEFAQVDYVEMAVYSRALTDAECQGIVDHWSRRYGIDGANRTST